MMLVSMANPVLGGIIYDTKKSCVKLPVDIRRVPPAISHSQKVIIIRAGEKDIADSVHTKMNSASAIKGTTTFA